MKVGIEYIGMIIETDELILACQGNDLKSIELHFKGGYTVVYSCSSSNMRDWILSIIQQESCTSVNRLKP